MSTTAKELQQTVASLIAPGKGILAADESGGTIEKRFSAVNVASTQESRRDYRELLFSTPGLNEFISGVILYDETIKQQNTTGVPLPDLLKAQGMLAGIKVDSGTVPLAGFPEEKMTEGLDGLAKRLTEYKQLGARFAKWRAVLTIANGIPTHGGIANNAYALARYAAICQDIGLVPIVEPEVLMDGDHTIETCAAVTEQVLNVVFHALNKQRVVLEYMILKPNMVVPGVQCTVQASPQQIADATLRCLRRTVPGAVPGITFLSGGQTDAAATENLNAMNVLGIKNPLPWQVSFSYGRALQSSAIKSWHGEASNKEAAQQALYLRARLNSAAVRGQYSAEMEAL
ncbi:class I fructose-bisphosphate aldolase [Glaciimonas immobilis]|uniref:Probable fructose-bisphosphate aldolase class 1 n=1 Tax=Glaciimonas immobilis TaxID=728004 RepID=A0A840RXL6_9BURK|nr:class I fructose-bisphosphate aldolase [Glaciimonas immobilis]KAF3998330.1 fructose-bisphosphate aldolase class I [Glaciimonas immobilis]MBB5201952.1 fructose-bisphosphate aldolase class I [Glaciimonas immobilis]